MSTGVVNLCGLTEDHDPRTFKSGRPTVDGYLWNEALKAQRSGLARTHVWAEAPTIYGYVTLTPIVLEQAQERLPKRAMGSRLQAPAILIAKLGIDGDYQGLGYGGDLLVEALTLTIQAADLIGGRLVVVDPGDETSRHLYERANFEELKGSVRMWLPIEDIRRALA